MHDHNLPPSHTTSTDATSIAKIVWEISHFLRDEWVGSEQFEPWPGLPSTPGRQPTLEEANFFFLGCCVDLQERNKVAWEKARRFFAEIVPPADRPFLWRWISSHSETEWVQRTYEYKLHCFTAFHKWIHRISTSLQGQFGRDPRTIWAPNNASRLLPILKDDLEVGPALSRMIVGALRDHQLVKSGKSDFKPDRHVCQQMHRLGLSPTSKVSDVLAAANKFFPDPWLADTALFYLGVEFGITGIEGLLEFHRQMTAWGKQRSDMAKQVPSLRQELLLDLGKDAWEVEIESSQHWIGLCLARADWPAAGLIDTNLR